MALEKRKGLFEELLKTFEECREANWDGYGAQPVQEKTYHLAHQFLAALPLSTPLPSIGAEPGRSHYCGMASVTTANFIREHQSRRRVALRSSARVSQDLRYGAVYWCSSQSRRGPDPPGYGCMKVWDRLGRGRRGPPVDAGVDPGPRSRPGWILAQAVPENLSQPVRDFG